MGQQNHHPGLFVSISLFFIIGNVTWGPRNVNFVADRLCQIARTMVTTEVYIFEGLSVSTFDDGMNYTLLIKNLKKKRRKRRQDHVKFITYFISSLNSREPLLPYHLRSMAEEIYQSMNP